MPGKTRMAKRKKRDKAAPDRKREKTSRVASNQANKNQEKDKKIFLSTMAHGKPYYLKEQHEIIIEEIEKKIETNSLFIMLSSEDENISFYYKEVLADILKRKFNLQILVFDPHAGPDLLMTINKQIENETVADLANTPTSEKNKYLIIDNENDLNLVDWGLVEILKKDLKYKKVGVLSLLPEPKDSENQPPYSNIFDIFQFDDMTDEDWREHIENISKSQENKFFLDQLGRFNLLEDDIAEKLQNPNVGIIQNLLNKIKFKSKK
ncbi:MAG: hypothetical protein VW557_06335 [Rhodospirillaceae bacterium]